MSDTIDTSTPKEVASAAKANLENSSEHARKAWEATTEAAKHVSDTVKKEAQAAFSTGKGHLGKAAQTLGAAASDTYETLRTQATQKAQAYRDRAEIALNEATAKAKNIQGDTEDYIRTNPLKSVGIAVGIGFILGVIIRR